MTTHILFGTQSVCSYIVAYSDGTRDYTHLVAHCEFDLLGACLAVDEATPVELALAPFHHLCLDALVSAAAAHSRATVGAVAALVTLATVGA